MLYFIYPTVSKSPEIRNRKLLSKHELSENLLCKADVNITVTV